jgi:hypothetical protein
MTIRHTLWVIDRTGPSHLVGNQQQTVLGTMSVLNAAFMAPLVSNLGDIAVALPATPPVPMFMPGDAVVFLVPNVKGSVIQRLRSLGNVGPKVLGKSSVGVGVPSMCEVYWERGFSDLEMADAVFHEAAHGMSVQGDEMHSFYSRGVGGSGVKVLAKQTPANPLYPSFDDLEFYRTAIGQQTMFVTTVP